MGVTGRELNRGIGNSTLPPRAVAKSVVNTIYCWKQLQLLGSGQLDEFPEHRCHFHPVLLGHLKWSSSCLATATTALLSRSPEPLQEGGVEQGVRQLGVPQLNSLSCLLVFIHVGGFGDVEDP